MDIYNTYIFDLISSYCAHVCATNIIILDIFIQNMTEKYMSCITHYANIDMRKGIVPNH